MKGASIIGSDESLVSTGIQEVGGNKKLAAKLLDGSTTSGIYKSKNFAIKASARKNTEKYTGTRIIEVSESLPKNSPGHYWS